MSQRQCRWGEAFPGAHTPTTYLDPSPNFNQSADMLLLAQLLGKLFMFVSTVTVSFCEPSICRGEEDDAGVATLGEAHKSEFFAPSAKIGLLGCSEKMMRHKQYIIGRSRFALRGYALSRRIETMSWRRGPRLTST